MKPFAKYVNQYELVYYHNPYHKDGKDIYTNDPTQFGFKPVIVPDPPVEEGYYAEADGWEEYEDEIRQLWTLVPIPDDLSDSEALEIILGGTAE